MLRQRHMIRDFGNWVCISVMWHSWKRFYFLYHLATLSCPSPSLSFWNERGRHLSYNSHKTFWMGSLWQLQRETNWTKSDFSFCLLQSSLSVNILTDLKKNDNNLSNKWWNDVHQWTFWSKEAFSKNLFMAILLHLFNNLSLCLGLRRSKRLQSSMCCGCSVGSGVLGLSFIEFATILYLYMK